VNDDMLSALIDRAVPEPPRVLPAEAWRRRPATRRRAAPVLAALGVTAIVGAATVALQGWPPGQSRGLGASQDCPATIDPSARSRVPEATIEGADRSLVPGLVPTAAAMCRYGLDGHLADKRAISNPMELVHDLNLPPSVGPVGCNDSLPGPAPYDLLMIEYGSKRLWIGQSSGGCTLTTNGRFVATLDLTADLASAYERGAWTIREDGKLCKIDFGRAGQESHMVPDGVTSVDVCGPGNTIDRTLTDPAVVSEVTDLLNSPEAHDSQGFCSGGPNGSIELVFRYPQGRAVSAVVMKGCLPGANTANGSLVAEVPSASITQLQRLTS
jgi:hypothetical protein